MFRASMRLLLTGLAVWLSAGCPLQAAIIYTDRAAWQAAIAPGVIHNTTALGSELDVISSVNLVGGGTLGFADSEVRSIGTSWFSWSGGYAGQVLFAAQGAADSLLISVAGLAALGFEVEPNDFSAWNITFALSDGSSATLPVIGDSGAQFFGFADASIVSILVSADPEAAGFALGNFYSVAAVPVPGPAALGLFALGLAGLLALRRRRA